MADSKHVDLTSGNPRRQLILFFLPLLFANTLQQLYNLANTWIVGNYVSKTALAAVAGCNPIILIFNYLFFGLGTGAGIVISNLYGAQKHQEVQKAIDTTLISAVVGGIIIVGISELSVPLFMQLCGIKAELWALTEEYLRVYLLGNAAVLVYNMSFFVMRSMGNSRQPLVYLAISCAMNFGLGIFMVRVLNWSVVGVAVATIISQLTVDIIILCQMARHKLGMLQIDIHNLHFSFSILSRILKLGIPAGVQNMLLAFSQMLVQSYINQFPNEVIAGIGAASKVDSFAQIPMSAISTACTTFVGQNLGAKKYDRVQHGVIDSIRLSNIMMIVVCTIVFATAPFLISLFNKDPLVVQHGTAMLRHTIFTFILLGWSHVYNGCCRGAGNMRIPLIIAVLCQCVLRYAFVYVGLKINYSVDILYWSEAVAFGSAGLCASLYFRFSRWTKEKQLRP